MRLPLLISCRTRSFINLFNIFNLFLLFIDRLHVLVISNGETQVFYSLSFEQVITIYDSKLNESIL